MHAWIMNLGAAILSFFRSINTAALSQALYIVGVGMLGIFIVTGVIILAVYLLNKINVRTREE